MIIRLNNISKKYKSFHALSNISFEILPSEIFGIVGPNGSGKTTTLGIILDLIKPSTGSVTFNNVTRKDIGAFLEHIGFIPDLSLKKNFEICCLIKGVKDTDIQNEIINRLELIDKEGTAYKNLSLGQKQRLAIASAIVGNPKVVIIDEPTNGLDPKGIIDIRNMILELKRQGKTIIIASHILSEMELICDRVAVYNKGSLVSVETIINIKQTFGSLENAFINLTSNELGNYTKN
jgi:ABC-2 type transport system ATP-binding protein